MRKICIVTGTRAEYGLLYCLLKEVQLDKYLELQIIVTGMHLSPEFGLTYQVIQDDGFIINKKIEMLLSSDTPTGIAKSIGLAVIGFADALDELRPDVLVVLGDRYEILAAVQAAMIAKIPVAHIHGGETTEGVIDEAIRHAVTKMAHIHFVAAEPYRQRVMQMGENPEYIFNVGAPGLDNLQKLKLLDRKGFEQAIDFELGDLNFLVTYHPVTLSKIGSEQAVKQLLTALDSFPEARIIFTKPNSDTDGRIIIKLIEEYASVHQERVKVCTSLGQLKYLSAIRHVDVVIGNSSSGLIEAPLLKKPTVNIGDRQRGRLKASSVIDCAENSVEIAGAIRKAISPGFNDSLTGLSPYYNDGMASNRIKETLKTINLDDILMKKFLDLNFNL